MHYLMLYGNMSYWCVQFGPISKRPVNSWPNSCPTFSSPIRRYSFDIVRAMEWLAAWLASMFEWTGQWAMGMHCAAKWMAGNTTDCQESAEHATDDKETSSSSFELCFHDFIFYFLFYFFPEEINKMSAFSIWQTVNWFVSFDLIWFEFFEFTL